MVFGKCLHSLICASAVAVLFLASATAALAKPNIVIILTDDQDDTGSIAYMPKVHQLIAQHGITFKNSFVNFPLCAPSRVSLLTGQAAHNHGIISNQATAGGGWRTFKEKEGDTLSVWLKAAGYKTALLGKYINGYGKDSGKKGIARNKERYAGSVLGQWAARLGKYLNVYEHSTTQNWVPSGWDLWYTFLGEKYYNYSINENGTILNFGSNASDYSTDVLKQRAVRFIEDQWQKTDPFFILISTKAPHGKREEGRKEIAATPSPQYETKFLDVKLPMSPAFNNPPSAKLNRDELEKEYRAALQSLQSVDDLVEAVTQTLQKTGKLDNTVIIYTSDNGFLFGDHGKRAKGALFEGAIRVPLLIRGPGIPENETREQLVNNLDVVATIEELAGLNPSLLCDGKSLIPLFADARAAWREALLFEKVHREGNNEVAIRTTTRKYVKHDDGSEELYDLIADPYELDDKVGEPSYADDLASLRSTLNSLRSCAHASCWIAQRDGPT